MKTTNWPMLALIIASGAILRMHNLGLESLWPDEAFIITVANLDAHKMIPMLTVTDTHPPLHAWILHYWMMLAGTSEYSARLPSAIFGILSVPAVYLVGRRLFSEEAGLISSALMAFSAFNIAYSQEARGYSLTVLLTLASMYWYTRAIERSGKIFFGLYVASTSLLIYTHLFGLFILLAQNAHYLLLNMKRKPLGLRRWVMMQFAVSCLIIPVIAFMAERFGTKVKTNLGWLPKPSIDSLTQTFSAFTGLEHAGLPYWVLIFWAAVAILPLLKRRKTSPRVTNTMVGDGTLIWLWLVAPILAPMVISLLYTPIYMPKYAIETSPALYIILARGLVSVRPGRTYIPLIACAVLLSAAGAAGYFGKPQKEQWRDATAYVEANAKPLDKIVFSDCLRQYAFEYYAGHGIGQASACAPNPSKLYSLADGTSRIWLINAPYKDVLSYPGDEFDGGYEVRSETKYVGIDIRLYEPKPDHAPVGTEAGTGAGVY